MRQGQHNKRPRGRNRKQGNSVNRSFESNGPDVKIRGNAAHVAEKYVTLARDALASGDPISGENYLQHAEHYFRIVSAAAAQQQTQQQAQRRPDDETNAPSEDKTGGDQDATGAAQNSEDASAPSPRRRRTARRGKSGQPPANANGGDAARPDDGPETANASSENDSDASEKGAVVVEQDQQADDGAVVVEQSSDGDSGEPIAVDAG